ncbi:MAG: hypothetical protein ACKOEX_10755 [Planctomycetia bacterium]
MQPSTPVGTKGEPAGQAAEGGSLGADTRRLRPLVAVGAGITVIVMLAAAVLLQYEPAFYREYREATAGGNLESLESMARRMVSKASALHAAARRSGSWDGVIRADEANAWLATDLPRNHRNLLPRGLESPRVAFRSQRVQLGARLRYGPFSSVAWVDVEPRLKGVNQVGLTVNAAGLGGLPLPRDAVVGQVAQRLARAGMVTDLRRNEGRLMVVVSPPATYDADGVGWRLESLAIDGDELLVAGSTGRGEKGADTE